MRRWLLVGLGLALGLAALHALVSSRAPHDEIDAASRERLERVLRDSGGEGRRR